MAYTSVSQRNNAGAKIPAKTASVGGYIPVSARMPAATPATPSVPSTPTQTPIKGTVNGYVPVSARPAGYKPPAPVVATPPVEEKKPGIFSKIIHAPGKAIQAAGDLLEKAYGPNIERGLAESDETDGEKALKKAASLVGGASPDNLPLGIGEVVKGYKDVYNHPENYSEFTLEDVLKGIVDTSKEVEKTPFRAAANFAGVPVKFNLPVLGEVTNRQYNAAKRINAGENPVLVAADEGVNSIFDTLFLAGLANEVAGPRQVVGGNMKNVDLNTIDATTGEPTKISVPAEMMNTPGPKSFRLYQNPPSATTRFIDPETVKTMIEQDKIQTTPDFNPELPTFFKGSFKSNGNFVGEVIQIKPSYFKMLTSLFGTKADPSFTYTAKEIGTSGHDLDRAIESGDMPVEKVYKNPAGEMTDEYAQHVVSDLAGKLDEYRPGLGKEFQKTVDLTNPTPTNLDAQALTFLNNSVAKGPNIPKVVPPPLPTEAQIKATPDAKLEVLTTKTIKAPDIQNGLKTSVPNETAPNTIPGARVTPEPTPTEPVHIAKANELLGIEQPKAPNASKTEVAPIPEKTLETKAPDTALPTAPNVSVPQAIDTGAVEKLHGELRSAYKAIPEAESALGEILTKLDLAEAGQRIFLEHDGTRDSNVIGVPSTFPAWIPDGLRTKKSLDALGKLIQDISTISYPSRANAHGARLLVNEMLNVLDSRLGVDTSGIRSDILKEYGKTQEPNREVAGGNKPAGRGEPTKEREVKQAKKISDLQDEVERLNKEIETRDAFEGKLNDQQIEERKTSKKEKEAEIEKLKPKKEPLAQPKPQEKIKVPDVKNIKIQEEKPKGGPVILQGSLIPGASEFFTKDVLPAGKNLADGTKQVFKEISTLFNPVGQATPEAVDILMKNKGKFEQEVFRMEQATKQIKKMWDKQPEEVRFDFMAKVEEGLPINKENFRGFEDLAQMYRDRLDNAHKIISEYKDVPFVENFFPHFWEKPNAITPGVVNSMAKRPLQGSRSFLKQRIFKTIQDGINAGYKPVSANPEELMQLYETNVKKFIMAQNIKADMVEKGLWKFVREGQNAPDDFARIDDSIAKIYYPVKLEAGGDLTYKGGEYWAQKDVARLINNYLSKDLIYDTAIGRGLMNVKNTLNAFQLGLSAFHLTMETLDTVITKTSIGLSRIVNGDIGKGLHDIALAPFAPFSYFKDGQKFFAGDAEMMKIEKDLFTGGASLRERQYYKNTVFDNFTKAVREGNYFGGLIRLPMATIEALMRPLFTYYIPRLKIGAFRDLFAQELERQSQKIQDGKTTQATVAREVWGNIENRMGELNYDNLFWNRNLKTGMMLAFRAVGWNLGTARELGGAIFHDIPVEGINVFRKGKTAEFTPKMSYTVSLFILLAALGAIYQYLHTGKKPEEIKDLYYPKNGAKDKSGEDYRVEFPTYLKDLYQFTHNPIQTVKNKLAPEFTMIMSLLNNKDFYGDYIRNTNDNLSTQTKQVALYLATQFVPFTIQQGINLKKGDSDFEQRVEAFFGIIKAPKEVIQSDYQKMLYDLYREQVGESGPRTPEQQDALDRKADAREAIKKGDLTPLFQLVQDGIISPKGMSAFLKNAQLTSDQRIFMGLSKEKKAELLKIMQEGESQ